MAGQFKTIDFFETTSLRNSYHLALATAVKSRRAIYAVLA
jgi:hypothetical protein